MAHAVSFALLGEVILLKDGVSRDFFLNISCLGTANKYIIIKAENGGQVKLSGTIGINAEGITGTYPKFTKDAFGIYRAVGKGPSGNPLSKSQVGPTWK